LFTSSPLSANFTPVKKAHSPLRGLTASRSTTLDTSLSQAPYHVRAKSIGKRFNDLQVNVDKNNAIARTEDVEKKIRELDDKITTNHNVIEDKIKGFDEVLTRVEETMAADLISQELLEERNLKEMKIVESNLALELQEEKQQNKESERKVLSHVEHQIQVVKVNFIDEQRRMDDLMNEQSQAISEKVSNLHQSIRQEQAAREQTHNTIIKNIGGKLTQFKETLDAQRKKRHDNEATLLQKMEEVCAHLQKQVNYENEKRERVENQMMNLLEEACNKFESRIRYSRR